MNCNPTLTREEFKVLHNTLWELGNINDGQVRALVERIRTVALKGAYEQDSAAFQRQWKHYDEVRDFLKLRTQWSIYEVEDLRKPHPYEGAVEVFYGDHWGDGYVSETIPGKTWTDLWVAAERCIEKSGDGHHVFIEGFRPVADKPGQLRLTTGS